MDETKAAAEQKLQDFVAERLQKEHPFLKHETTNAIAQKCKEILNETLAHLSKLQLTGVRTNFLSLPAELRNRIYDLALIPSQDGEGGQPNSRAVYIGRRVGSEGQDSYRFGERTGWAVQPALTKVSRQLRRETLPIYYGSNHFIIYSAHESRGRKSSKVSYPAGVRWVMAMGPENVQLLKDIRVRSTPYAGSFDLPDLCPATRFIAHAGRNGVDLPRGCVSGFAYAFFTHHDGEDLKVLLHAYGIYKVWKMVDEACLVYRNSFDVLPVKGETRSLTFVASTWDYQTKPRTLKNA